MEVTERFELFGKQCIKDNNPEARSQLFDAYVACVSLDEQDKRIKELEEKDKEVVEEIRQLVNKEKEDNDLVWLGFKKLNRILDQVEKGENNETN